MHPLPRELVQALWQHAAQAVARGERALLVAEEGLGVCGAVGGG